GAKLWGSALVSALVAGYLTAYLVIFPAPILHGHQLVPRVLGLTLQEASAELRKAGLQVQDGGSEPHPTAPQGTVIWQDPPAGRACDRRGEPRGTDDSGAAPARHVAGGRAHPARARGPDARHGDAAPHRRREPGNRRGAAAGSGDARRRRHSGGHCRGAEPAMTNGIRIPPSVLAADLTRLAQPA